MENDGNIENTENINIENNNNENTANINNTENNTNNPLNTNNNNLNNLNNNENNCQSQSQSSAENFLEVSVINEIIQNIDEIENKYKTCIGQEVVDARIKQLAYAKILCNVYAKDINYLIKAYTQLGISYLDINYFEQSQEHLLNAFKLNENSTDNMSLSTKEYQIKILINLSKCYMENDKLTAALAICQKSLKMNQTLLGENHVSNADIYYVLAKV